MRHLSEYVSAPLKLFNVGMTLPVNLYIYMPENKNVLFFRRTGDLVSGEDCETMSKIPKGNLLLPRDEQRFLYSSVSKKLAEGLKSGELKTAEIQASAAMILETVSATTVEGSTPSGDFARESLLMAPKLVEDLMAQIEKTPSILSYEAVIQRLKKEKIDPITLHSEQVSALAVLICLTIGIKSPEEIGIVGTAALLHDLGMRQIPKALSDKHILGGEELTVSEEKIYMTHVDLSVLGVKKTGIKVSDAVLVAIRNHHENYNGSGFKGLSRGQIDRAARIIRIADDIVVCISHPKNSFGFKEAVGNLTMKDRHLKDSTYDPEIMDALGGLK